LPKTRIDSEFDGALTAAGGEHKRAFTRLQDKIQKLGVAVLSSEEKQQYLQALSARGKGGHACKL
jgi:hypothetical protein